MVSSVVKMFDVLKPMADRGCSLYMFLYFKIVDVYLCYVVKHFGYLVDGQAPNAIEDFMNEEHTFEEYAEVRV